MQVDWAGQAAVKLLTSPIAGRTGVGWMCQFRPFHRSARVPKNAFPELSVSSPAAVQDEADVYATPPKPLPGAGLGVRWMAQLLPFHRSARVATGFPAIEEKADRHTERSRCARYAGEAAARRSGGVGRGLDRPVLAVPPFRERARVRRADGDAIGFRSAGHRVQVRSGEGGDVL